MGVLVRGKWVHDDSKFKMNPSVPGSVFMTPHAEIEVEGNDRFYLYVVDGCPWAARAWLTASTLGLLKHIRIIKLFPANAEDGWFFSPVSEAEKAMVETVSSDPTVSWCREEPLMKATHLHQIYTLCDPNCSGRVSVPLLVDSKTRRAVSSESLDIARIFIERFNSLHQKDGRLNKCLTSEVSELSQYITQHINGQVYKAHMAQTQIGFDEACESFFDAVRTLEYRLECNQDAGHGVWLFPGPRPTLVDLQAFATLVRFDCSYHHRFRMTQHTISGGAFPRLWEFVRRLYQIPEVRSCCHWSGIRAMYYLSEPLRVKAGRTVAAMPDGYEAALCQPIDPIDTKRVDVEHSSLLNLTSVSLLVVATIFGFVLGRRL